MGAVMPVCLGVIKDTFESLPPDLQHLMADMAVDLNASEILERRNAALKKWEELGITRHEMPDKDQSQWADALEDMPRIELLPREPFLINSGRQELELLTTRFSPTVLDGQQEHTHK